MKNFEASTRVAAVWLVLVLGLGQGAQGNDLELGRVEPDAALVFHETRGATPALWVRSETLVVPAGAGQRIVALRVVDLRDDKAGQALVTAGGLGDSSVTLELSGPSVLRGYTFEVWVYAAPATRALYRAKGADTNIPLDRYEQGQYYTKS